MLFTNVISEFPAVVGRCVRCLGANHAICGFLIPTVFVMFLLVVTCVIFVSGTREELPVRCTGHIINHGVCNNRSARVPVGVGVDNMLPVVFTSSVLSLPNAIRVFVSSSGCRNAF